MAPFAVLNKVLGLQLFWLFGVWFHWSVAQADSKRRSKILLVCPFKNSHLPRNQTHSYCCICAILVTGSARSFRLLSGQCGILVTSIVFWDSVEVGDTIWFFKTHPHLSLHVKLICKSLKMSDHKKYLRRFVHWIEMDFLHKWKSIISF